MIADYEFYTDTYHGSTSAFDSDNWESWQDRAEDKLDYLTCGRLGQLTEYSDAVKKAVCAIADMTYAIDSIKQGMVQNGGSVVGSMSSLGVSVSYTNDITDIKLAAISRGAEDRLLRRIAGDYLRGSGLLYAGF